MEEDMGHAWEGGVGTERQLSCWFPSIILGGDAWSQPDGPSALYYFYACNRRGKPAQMEK